jgi:hypothetical protein
MKKILLTITLLVTIGPLTASAQDKLIILVRHAEKAELETDGNPDPELSEAGKQRAERFNKSSDVIARAPYIQRITGEHVRPRSRSLRNARNRSRSTTLVSQRNSSTAYWPATSNGTLSWGTRTPFPDWPTCCWARSSFVIWRNLNIP